MLPLSSSHEPVFFWRPVYLGKSFPPLQVLPLSYVISPVIWRHILIHGLMRHKPILIEPLTLVITTLNLVSKVFYCWNSKFTPPTIISVVSITSGNVIIKTCSFFTFHSIHLSLYLSTIHLHIHSSIHLFMNLNVRYFCLNFFPSLSS